MPTRKDDQTRRTLSEYPYKEKDEILDWTRIPAGRCDLNFRPLSAHPTGDIREIVVWLGVVATVAGFFGLVLRYLLGPFLGSSEAFSVALGAGVLVAMANLLVDYLPWPIVTSQIPPKWTVPSLFCLPLVLCSMALWLSRAAPVLGPFSMLMMLAVPMLLLVGDLMTTHAVHWMSAHPCVAGNTMKRWRTEWQQRFQGFVTESTELRRPAPRQDQVRAAVHIRDG